MKKQILLGALAVTGAVCMYGCGKSDSNSGKEEKGKVMTEPVTVEKSEYHNPITGFGKDGSLDLTVGNGVCVMCAISLTVN